MKTLFRILVLLAIEVLLLITIHLCRGGVVVVPGTAAKGSSAIAPGPTDAIAWYKFDNDLTDASASGNGLAGNNSPTFATGQDGAANHALVLNGSNQNAIKNAPSNLPSGDTSFSAWVYSTSSSGSRVIVCLGANSGASRNDLYLQTQSSAGTGNFSAVQFINGAFANGLTSGTFPLSTWTLLCAVFHASSGHCDMYINGAFDSTVTLGAGFPSSVNTVSVGAFVEDNGTYLNFFQGSIDDVRIYSRALTSTEVASLYTGQSAWQRARPDFYLAFQTTPNIP